MITIEQCRAARGLLGWTQQDLADACGLSKTAINNYEKSHSDMKAESLRAIRMAFESADIEFLEDHGLKKRSDNAEILRGSNALSLLLDDIAITCAGGKTDILVICTACAEDSAFRTANLQARLQKLPQSHMRVICAEKSLPVWRNYGTCRMLNSEIAPHIIMTFLYGEKMALIFRDESAAVILRGPDIFSAEQGRFESLWAQTKPISNGHHGSSIAK